MDCDISTMTKNLRIWGICIGLQIFGLRANQRQKRAKFGQRTWLIKLFEFGSTKSQRQINTANPDVRNEIKTISAFLYCQNPISLFPTAHSIFSSSWLNIFFHFFLHFLVEGPTVAALRDNNYIQANINIILPFLYCRKNHTWPCCTWLYLRISPCCQRPGPRPSCLWCTRWRTRRQTNPKHILFEYK